MMRSYKFILIGIILSITLYRAEAVSWYRIFEMFHFQSSHMVGIILFSIAAGMVLVQLTKRTHMRDLEGHVIAITDKENWAPRYLWGGLIFGLGWARAGVCPGPMFSVHGNGITVLVVILLAAITDAFFYGLVSNYQTH